MHFWLRNAPLVITKVVSFLVKLDDYWELSRPKESFLWKSTGLYAKAGTIVEVTVPAELVNNSQVGF